MADYIKAKTYEEWLELRNKGLGGSDIGTALGFNSFKSPYQLWAEKTGLIEPEDISDKVAIQIGNELEDLVARMFTQETGLEVRKDNKTYYHDDHPFLLANIDRKIVGQKALLECKTTSVYNESSWDDDEVPASYLLQVQHYLNVLDFDKAYIAVLIGNHRFVWKEIERDNDLIAAYQTQAVNFWEENVLKLNPPEIDGSEATKEAIEQIYSSNTTSQISLPLSQIQLVSELEDIKRDIKTFEAVKGEKENKIREFMGKNEAEIAVSDKFKITWKSHKRNTIDSKRLKEEQPDIYKQYLKQSVSTPLRIKEME